MKLTRRKRIALELLGPAFLGGTVPALFLVPAALGQVFHHGELLRGLKETTFFMAAVYGGAYALAGLQSIAYTLVMEWRFTRGLEPRSGRTVVWSTALGFLSGAAIIAAYGPGRSDATFLWVCFGGIGTVVGLALGLLIRALSPVAPVKSAGSP